MTVMERLANSIVVPVVVLDKVEDAIPTAKAMAAGGVDTMEITFRTAQGHFARHTEGSVFGSLSGRHRNTSLT